MRVIDSALAATFGTASKIRGTKVFHPHGVVHAATVRISDAPGAPEGAPLLRTRAEHRAIVRVSRATGLRRPIPDVRGLAIRLLDVYGPDRHQDFLLVTSGDGLLAQHLLLPARQISSLPYSCLAPYRIDGELYIIGAYARPSVDWRSGGDFEQLNALAASGRPAFDLGIARLGQRLRPFGTLTFGDRLPDEANATRFNVYNTGDGLEPATFVNRWRKPAYAASQAAWAGAPASNLTDEGK